MKKFISVLLPFLVMILCACNSSSSPTNINPHVQPVSASEVAVSSISGTAEASETAIEMSQIRPKTSGTCLAANINCAGNPATFGETYSDCAFGGFGINGSIAYNFSDEVGCDTALTSPGSLADGEVITRLLNLQVTGPSELDISVSSSASGFTQQVSGGTSVSCGAGGCVDNRTITINGEHWTGAVNGGTFFDFTLSSTAVAVSGVGSSRVISSGIVTVQSNRTQEVATASFNGPVETTSGCCFPTLGSVTTTFVNGANTGKTETLNFGPTCGSAQLTNVAGVTSTVTLAKCF